MPTYKYGVPTHQRGVPRGRQPRRQYPEADITLVEPDLTPDHEDHEDTPTEATDTSTSTTQQIGDVVMGHAGNCGDETSPMPASADAALNRKTYREGVAGEHRAFRLWWPFTRRK